MNDTMQNPHVKLAKLAVLLFMFQIATALTLGFILYILTDFLKILPTINNNSLSAVGVIIAGMLFGYRIESRNPEMLDKKKIKKLALYSTLINLILASLLIYVAHLIENRPPLDLLLFSILAGFFVFIGLLNYFATKFAIAQGIKSTKRKKDKTQPTAVS